MVKITGQKEIEGNIKLDPGSAPTAEKGVMYYDLTADKFKVSIDGSTFINVIDSADVGTGANELVQLDGDAKLPAVDGSNLTNVDTATFPDTFFLNQQCIVAELLTRTSNDDENYLRFLVKDEVDFATSTCMRKRDVAFCHEMDFVDSATLDTNIWTASTAGTGVVDIQGVDAETYYIRVYASESH